MSATSPASPPNEVTLAVFLFLYGLLVGFVLVRLRRGPGAGGRAATALGWLAAAMSLTLAAALIAYAAWMLV